MRIPALSGIYVDSKPDFRTSYPRNIVPVPKAQGISKGYVRPAPGIQSLGAGPGLDRGGVNFDNQLYRVMGTKFCAITEDGGVTELGSISGTDPCRFDFTYTELLIIGGGELYVFDGVSVIKVTSTNLGSPVIDATWLGDYTIATDGTKIYMSDLADPLSWSPSNFGEAELDPDELKAVVRIRGEIYAVGRYSVEVFQLTEAVGAWRMLSVPSAHQRRGAIGTHCAINFLNTLAFIGSGRNEAPAIYLGLNADTTKVSTREVDQILREYSEAELENVVLEAKIGDHHEHLYVHLPNQTLVYDAAASLVVEQPVWFTLDSGTLLGKSRYRARGHVWCYDRWNVGDPTTTAFGYLDDAIGSHYGNDTPWEFNTIVIYNESNDAIMHKIEITALTGTTALGESPKMWTSYSNDGRVWSMPRSIDVGYEGQRMKVIGWRRQGRIRKWRIQRFQGNSDARISMAVIIADIEPLSG